MKDLQSLLLWISADGINQRWCFVKNKDKIPHLCVVCIPGLQYSTYVKHSAKCFPCLAPHCTAAAQTRLQGRRTGPHAYLWELLHRQVPRVSEHQRRKVGGMTTADAAKLARQIQQGTQQGTPKIEDCQGVSEIPLPTAEAYLLTEAQLLENDFPLLTSPGFKVAHPAPSDSLVQNPRHMLALDCEMCVTTQGLELTRCSIVDANGEVLFDELVKPDNPIVDYVTKYSGMTAERLENVTTTLEDVQTRLLDELIFTDTILVGHSLENDLKALQIAHTRVLDTSVMYPHSAGPPMKKGLKHLAGQYLKIVIQDSADGHCSVVDAQICMKLAQLKLLRGPEFGQEAFQQQHIFHAIEHSKRFSPCPIDRAAGFVGKGPIHGITVNSDSECAAECAKILHGAVDTAPPGAKAIWATFYGLWDYLSAQDLAGAGSPPDTVQDATDAAEADALRKIDQHIGQLIAAAPLGTAFFVMGGQGFVTFDGDSRLTEEQTAAVRKSVVLLFVKSK
eukprot:TRINITY_DN8835_c0_g1_i1.p1 TRINITY_DN8835_c0_g1~~TRINITY_DN8835_c0_g1_i1.p1  ORF type:complete len:552 (-),score=82.00 TRINITY_DN8835_c0_g1_i1:8-1522(-)